MNMQGIYFTEHDVKALVADDYSTKNVTVVMNKTKYVMLRRKLETLVATGTWRRLDNKHIELNKKRGNRKC